MNELSRLPLLLIDVLACPTSDVMCFQVVVADVHDADSLLEMAKLTRYLAIDSEHRIAMPCDCGHRPDPASHVPLSKNV